MSALSSRIPVARPKWNLRTQEAVAFYLCILPWMIGFILFYLGPILASAYYSLTRWDLLTPPVFVGLANYEKIFTRDPYFLKSLKITLVYTMAFIPLDAIFGLLTALLMNQRLRGIGIFRTIYYLPSVLSGVAYVVMWMWMFNPQHGLINNILAMIGIDGPRWLLDPKWALPSIIMMSLWGIGRSMIIYLAGLQDIPGDMYEAAQIDGANRWNQFWKITLPLLTPSILFNLIFGIIMTFQTFTNAFVATNGGPLDSTLFYVLYLYRKAFEHLQMGYASALAWILFLIVLLCTLVIFLSSGKWVFYRSTGE